VVWYIEERECGEVRAWRERESVYSVEETNVQTREQQNNTKKYNKKYHHLHMYVVYMKCVCMLMCMCA